MGQLLIIKCSWFKDNDELGWHYPRWLASRYTLVLHGFVVHESYVLCVLTNRVALLTANHSSLLHSLSYPEERCRGRTAFFFFFFFKKAKKKNQVSLFVSLSFWCKDGPFTYDTPSFFFSSSCICALNRCSKELHCKVGHQVHSGHCLEVFWKQVPV